MKAAVSHLAGGRAPGTARATVHQPMPIACAAAAPPLLVVFSHLRWSFVWQRPQHIMSRLAGRWNVLFVEEPVRADGPPRLDVQPHGPHLTVLVPRTPVPAAGFHDAQLAALQALLAGYLDSRRLVVDVAWLYTPMALPLLPAVRPACVVYDCIDEPSASKDAPRQLRQRESALLKTAALVLTGGPSLYEAKRELHPQVACLPSAVDAAHYAPSSLVADSAPALAAERVQGGLARPRLGFFGVIDERLDARLVAALADAHPEWSLVMAGPVVRIDPAALPRRPSVHWIGMQPYDRLPYLLAGWDICLLPFALNDSTRFISPMKTLEYLAGDKPVVSTPIRDVIGLFGEAVEVAAGPDAFVAACERLLDEPPAAQCRRAIDALTLVSRYSWDRNVDTVHGLMTQALARSRAPADATPAPAGAIAGLRG